MGESGEVGSRTKAHQKRSNGKGKKIKAFSHRASVYYTAHATTHEQQINEERDRQGERRSSKNEKTFI